MKAKLYSKIKHMALFLAFTVFVMGFSMFTVIGDVPAHIYGGDETTTAGSDVELPLFIESNPGVAAFTLELSYDKDTLTFTDAVASSVAGFDTEQWLLEVYGDCFLWSNDTEADINRTPYNTVENGEMFNLTFAVAPDAQPGIYPVEIQLKDSQAANISDCNGVPVDVTFTAGVIRIEDTAGQKTVTNVTLYTPADKLAYWTGESFDITGAQLKVEYSDNTSDYVNVTEQMLAAIPDTDTAGTKTVQVKYQNWEYVNDLTFDIEVKEPTINNVTLYTPADKLAYWTGETFDITGAQLKLEWTNGDTTYMDVTEQMLEAMPDMTTEGTKTIQVEYLGYEDINDLTFDIEVNDPDVKNVTLYTPADKLEYWTGETFDITGAQLKLEWTNGDTTYMDVTEQMLEAMPDMTTEGTKTIQIEYLGWEDVNDLTFDIEVKQKDAEIKNVTLYTPADKLNYFVGDDFEIDGAQLKVEWTDGSVTYVDVTDAMLEAMPDMSTEGVKIIQIIYQDWEAVSDLTFEISVSERTNPVVGAEMNPAPTQKVFNQGEAFNSVGGKIKITYENGDVEYIDITEDMCSGYDMNVPGEYEVTVSYEGFEFSYVITVNAVENPSSGDFNLIPLFVGLLMSAVVVCVSIYAKKRKSFN